MKTIVYLGPENSYSYLAAKQVFPRLTYKPCKTFSDILSYVESDGKSIGILPVENSIIGPIYENKDAVSSNKFAIIAKTYLQINLHLIGLQNSSLSNIHTVHSHPKAFLQCSKFIRNHTFKTEEAPSTSEARAIVMKKNNLSHAFIGSRHLADNSSLQIIQKDIGDEKNNLTHFIFIAKQ